jgi:hypothetical protein
VGAVVTDTEKFQLVAQWMSDIPCERAISVTVYEQHPVLLVRGDETVFTARWGTPVAFTNERGAVISRWTHPAGFFVESVVMPDDCASLVAS